MPNVEAQVYFLEIAVKRKGNSENAGPKKKKSDHADIGDRVKRIEFQAARDQSLEQLRINGVIEHHEVPPFRGEKNWFDQARSIYAYRNERGLLTRSAQELVQRRIGFGAESEGLFVMAPGQFLCRRLRGRVNHGQIEMRVGVFGVVRDRLEHFFLGRFLPALLARGDSQVVVRRRAFRIDRERFGQLGKRVVKLALLVVDDPEGGVSKFIRGREGDRFLERELGGFEFAVAE